MTPRCTGPDCNRPAESAPSDLCVRHAYQRRQGKPLTPIRGGAGWRPCAGPDCDREGNKRGLCESHRSQRAAGLPLTPLRPAIPRRTLTADQADALIEDYRTGTSQRELQLKYGVSRRTVEKCVAGIDREGPTQRQRAEAQRAAEAAFLLEFGEWPVDVARRCGYGTLSAMVTRLKRHGHRVPDGVYYEMKLLGQRVSA